MSTVHVMYDGTGRDFEFSDLINSEIAPQIGISSDVELIPSNFRNK